MGQFSENFDKIIRDLKESNYFRIWLLIWLACFVIFFVAFGVLAERSRIAATIGSQTTSVQHEDKIHFPRFHIRHQASPSVACFFENLHVPTRKCTENDPTCITVLADTFIAVDQRYNYTTRRILCNVTTANPGVGVDGLLAWELEQASNWGPNMGASLWIAPNEAAWILLTKDIVHGTGGRAERWERYLLYHSTLSHPASYQITVLIDSFDVDIITLHDNPYTGWMALGDMGGVAFFLLILHTIVMIVVGVFFTNSSSFLKPISQEYTRITT